MTYRERGRAAHQWSWRWEDVQQLVIAPRRLRVLTYQDSRWKLGRDREHRFDLEGAGGFEAVWVMLRDRMDQRLVAALAMPQGERWWSAPVKQLRPLGGRQGELIATSSGLVFSTPAPGASRTWRWRDLENLSRTGPFLLEVTTYERPASGYGGLKTFLFQLKRLLEDAAYRRARMHLERHQGLKTFLFLEGRLEQ
ncbi:MAG: hypothetical protein ACP5U2_08355 [Bryobacteraceae bacterium]